MSSTIKTCLFLTILPSACPQSQLNINNCQKFISIYSSRMAKIQFSWLICHYYELTSLTATIYDNCYDVSQKLKCPRFQYSLSTDIFSVQLKHSTNGRQIFLKFFTHFKSSFSSNLLKHAV